mmetsp:Transcript_9646/g.35784  ORF Transcript_9646/g.35784 Transcript_9646/m.35784 type:complete len:236 (+) Transcript_9646:486-1193(+)
MRWVPMRPGTTRRILCACTRLKRTLCLFSNQVVRHQSQILQRSLMVLRRLNMMTMLNHSSLALKSMSHKTILTLDLLSRNNVLNLLLSTKRHLLSKEVSQAECLQLTTWTPQQQTQRLMISQKMRPCTKKNQGTRDETLLHQHAVRQWNRRRGAKSLNLQRKNEVPPLLRLLHRGHLHVARRVNRENLMSHLCETNRPITRMTLRPQGIVQARGLIRHHQRGRRKQRLSRHPSHL